MYVLFFSLVLLFARSYGQSMSCSYGPRGSLTAVCVNATPSYFRVTPYRFDNLDQMLVCKDCNLAQITAYTFDLPGNEIKTLNISSSQVRILEKKAFIGLVYMTELFLRNNSIGLISSETFQGVKMLVVLDLAYNSIKRIVDNGFQELETLSDLDLSHNQIEEVELNGFNGLVSLINLNLEHNRIQYACRLFPSHTKIRTINLKNNLIEDVPPRCFEKLDKLNELNLARNKITSLSYGTFRGLSILRTLNLSFNSLVSIDSAAFYGLYFLEELLLGHNMLEDIHKLLFRGLSSLRELDLAANSILNFKTNYFNGVPELRFLNLSSNKIEQLKKTGVLPLANLHTLDFSNNKIRAIDSNLILAHIPRIQNLYLRNNPIPCQGVVRIEKIFNEQDVNVLLDKVQQPCNDSSSEEAVPTSEESTCESCYAPSNYSGPIIALFVFISLIIASLLLSAFLQYRSYWAIRKIIKSRNDDETHLIVSSEIEAREQEDY